MKYFPELKVVLFLSLLLGAGSANTIHVGGPGDPCGLGDAHTTIQEAIDAAEDGDIISVCGMAEYHENVIVNRSVDIIAEGADEAVVSALIASDPVLSISADNVGVSGLVLKDATGSYGLYATGSNARIERVMATNNDIGFFLHGSSHNTLDSNIAHDNLDEGFRLSSGSDHNNLTGNVAYNQLYYGFYLFESNNNTLTSNTAYNSTAWYGFFLYSGATGNVLQGNEAYGNAHNGFHVFMGSDNQLIDNAAYENAAEGFRFSSSSGNLISGNTASDNGAEGFRLSSSSDNDLVGNNAYDNLLSGFMLSSCSGNSLTGNSASGNSLYGFHLYLSSANELSSNEAHHQEDGFHLFGGTGNALGSNSAHDNNIGFYMDTSSDNDLDSNTAYDNAVHGFLFSSCSGNDIAGNDAHGNSEYGFYAYLGSDNLLQDNLAHGNLNGFLISSSAHNHVLENTAYSNSNAGIFLYMAPQNILEGNTVNDNSFHGIYLYESPKNTLLGNNASGNGYNGIYVYKSPNNGLSGNMAEGNLQHGIVISSSANAELEGNEASGNSEHGYYVLLSSRTAMSGNAAHGNSMMGCYIRDSRDCALENEHYYNNSIEFGINASESAVRVEMLNTIMDGPSGDLQDYSNISLSDRLSPSTGYRVRWASQPGELPHPHISFENKYLEITGPGVSIDSLSWHWLDTESAAYRESMLQAWQHNSDGWVDLGGEVDEDSNTLTIHDLVPASIYGLLQNRSLPTFTLHSPAPGDVVNTTDAVLNWTVHSSDPTAYCNVTVDGDKANGDGITVVSGMPEQYVIALAEGGHSWSVTCGDSVGTNSSGTNGFTLDLPPSVHLDDPEDEYIDGPDHELGFTATDSVSSGLECSLYVDGSIDQSATVASSVPSSFTVSGLSEGPHSAQVICADEVDNQAASESKGIILDSTAPQISLISPPDGHVGDESTMQFDFTATDALSPTLEHTLYLDGAPVQSGSEPHFSAPVTEGAHDWHIGSTDLAGNTATSETRTFTIDRTPPSVTLTSPTDDPHVETTDPADVDLVFIASDDDPTLDCTLFLDGIQHQASPIASGSAGVLTASGLDEGMYEAYVSCSDDAGNAGETGALGILVDGTPPSIVLISPEDDYYGSDDQVTFTFTATDEISDVASTLYIDGVSSGTTSGDSFTVSVDEGSHTWRIRSVDEAGNERTSETRDLTLDQSAPVITLDSPPNGHRIISSEPQDVTFSFTVTDNQAPEADCEFHLDGSVSYSGSVQSGDSVTLTRNLEPGTHNWFVECSDDVDNTRVSQYRTVRITSGSSEDDDDDDEGQDDRITLSVSQKCPENELIITASSGPDTTVRLLDPDGLLLGINQTGSGGNVSFIITEAGGYEVRASKSNYRPGLQAFGYTPCYIPQSDDDDDRSGGEDPGEQEPEDAGDDGTGGEEEPQEQPEDPPEEEPGEDPGSQVDIFVDGIAYKGDVVDVQVFVDSNPASVTIRVTTPENEILTITTDASGRASFRADELGRYQISVIDPKLPFRSRFVSIVERSISGSSSPWAYLSTLCIPIFLPFLLLLLALLVAMTYYASRERKRESRQRYRGYGRKEGLASKLRGLLGKDI